jgi:predicted amidohydrolase
VFDRLSELGVDIVCLPEYFFIPDRVKNQVETFHFKGWILETLEAYSRRLVGVVVGGSLVEKEGRYFYNTCHVFDCGRHVGYYRKVHPTEGEREKGIQPGDSFEVFEVRGIRLGVLICADVLYPSSFEKIAERRPDLIAVPTTSPYVPGDTVADKKRRDHDIFVAGARRANAFILKACGVGTLMGKRLQGRSLICAPWGIIEVVNPRSEMLETVLTAKIDVDVLHSGETASAPIGI